MNLVDRPSGLTDKEWMAVFCQRVSDAQGDLPPGAVVTFKTGVKCRQVPDRPDLHNLQLPECSFLIRHDGPHSWGGD